MNDQERLALMLEYVAGTLDADAAERVRAGLASGSPDWAAARADAEATLAAYAAAITPVAPRPGVKGRLLSRIARGRTTSRPAGKPQASSGGARPFARGLAAVAALVLIAVLVNAWTDRRIVAEVDRARLAYQAQIRERDAKIVMLQSVIDRDAEVREVLKSARFKVVDLGSENTKAVGRILIDENTRTWHVFAAGLAQLPKEKVYELWYITADGTKIAADAFVVDASGNGTLKVRLPAELKGIAVAAITDELAPLAQQPAGSVHLAGKVE